jgi:hypothetical protein
LPAEAAAEPPPTAWRLETVKKNTDIWVLSRVLSRVLSWLDLCYLT